MVYRLVYISKAKHDINDRDLQQILSIAREKNARLGITGLLLFQDNQFLQVLEGDQDRVQVLYNKILLDERHITMKCLQVNKDCERLYGGWSMAYLPISPDQKQKLMGAGDFYTNFTPTSASDEAERALTQFIKNIADKMIARAQSS